MKRKYKNSFLIINAILIVTIIISLINCIIIKNTSFLYLFLISLIPFLILFFRLGYEKKKRRFTYETMFYTFTYVIVLFIILYVIGIFIGFTQNVYRFSLSNIIRNVIPYIAVIFITEIFRYEIIRKGEGSILSYILSILLFLILDSTLFLNTFDLATYDGVIKFVCSIVFPSIFKNILLLFLAKNGGPHPCIIYRLIMDLRVFLIPISPDFGLYIESVVYTAFPVIVGGLTFVSLKQFQNKEVGPQKTKGLKIYKYVFIIILLMATITINLLTSCKFKYAMIAIGSNSMNPLFYKGDAVLYENNYPIDKYEIGDILVFKKDAKTVVHRIIEIKEVSKERIFYTKGDNNNGPDGYPIREEDIIGRYKNRVKFVGIFSVYLKELFKS